MPLNALRFVTILLAALTMGMKFAHALELLPKLLWEAELYLNVQTSLYRVFGTLGPFVEVGTLLAAGALAYQVRRTPAFPFTATSLIITLLSLGLWLAFVLPANAQINQWAATQVTPPDWMRWRDQWQFGQAATFGLHLVGLGALLHSVIQETPAQLDYRQK